MTRQLIDSCLPLGPSGRVKLAPKSKSTDVAAKEVCISVWIAGNSAESSFRISLPPRPLPSRNPLLLPSRELLRLLLLLRSPGPRPLRNPHQRPRGLRLLGLKSLRLLPRNRPRGNPLRNQSLGPRHRRLEKRLLLPNVVLLRRYVAVVRHDVWDL